MIHDGYGHQASQRVTVFVSDNLFHTERGNQFTSSHNGSTFRVYEHWDPCFLLLETTLWSAKVHPGRCNNGGKHRRSPCFHVHPCRALCICTECIEDKGKQKSYALSSDSFMLVQKNKIQKWKCHLLYEAEVVTSLVLGMSEDIEDQPPWLMLQQGSSP